MTAATFDRARSATLRWPSVAFMLPIAAAGGAALMTWGMTGLSAESMSSVGLVSVLDWRYPVGLAVMVVALTGELFRSRPRSAVLGGLIVALTIGLFGLAPAVEGAARLPTSYLHAGFTQYISTHGAVLPRYDARFSWPGFFSAAAVMTRTAGLANPLPLLAWAPTVFMLLYLAPLRVITRRLGMSERASWVALVLFVIGNWTEEEYFSPQACAYLLALALLALSIHSDSDRGTSLRVRISQLVIWVILAFAIVATHQLTPFAVTAWLIALLIGRRARWPFLTPLLPLLAAAWLAFAARDFWEGHRSVLFGGVGSVGSTVNSSLGSRLDGSPVHHEIVELRIVITVVMLGLAALGCFVKWRSTRSLLLPAGVLIPFGLVGLQSYGGEILIRADLFALPFLALAGAEALDFLGNLRLPLVRIAGRVSVGAVLVGLTAALVVARGGNDPYVAMTESDVAVASAATSQLPAGSTITFLTGFAPLRAARVGVIGEASLQDVCLRPGAVARCVKHVAPQALFVSQGQQAFGELVEGWPAGWMDTAVQRLVTSGRYRVWLASGDAEVLLRASTRPTDGSE